MKYLVVVGDGMADYPYDGFGGKTALEIANTPNFDALAALGEVGLVRTVPPGFPPGSDTANLSLFGYDPCRYYTGRSPLEAASMGIELQPEDISFRCNFVTLSDNEPYECKKMVDYSAGEISTEEAVELVKAIKETLLEEPLRLYPGFRYRHLLVWNSGPDCWKLTPPHDISGRQIGAYLPDGAGSKLISHLMASSYDILSRHPINLERVSRGLSPANAIWIWGEGKKPVLPTFQEKYGLRGAVISAVDLIKGIGLLAGLEIVEVEGATGDIDTNYEGKVRATLDAFRKGGDFVYLHIEAPDECSHRFEAENKVRSIELIDERVVKVIRSELEKGGFDFSVLLVTDHATPLELGTHTSEPVPFAIFRSKNRPVRHGYVYSEKCAVTSGNLVDPGYSLMDRFLGKRPPAV